MLDTYGVLNHVQIAAIRDALDGKLINLCFGAGVDSTAMIVALKIAGIRPDLITFADLKSEKRATYEHLDKMQQVLRSWGWPTISVVSKKTLESTGYDTLYGNCVDNETLPSLAFGRHSCSHKWKILTQDQFLMGVSRGPNMQDPHPLWLQAQASNKKICKLIGYDNGKADLKRSSKLTNDDPHFDYCYPLQLIGWSRPECIKAIIAVMGEVYVPPKSACFFCPASKEWELYWLAAFEPELLEQALYMERNALTGRHSRFDELMIGKDWEDIVRSGERFPSTTTTVGLGRSFAWSQWAWVNQVVDDDFKVIRSPEKTIEFIKKSDELRKDDNALDNRGKKVIKIQVEENVWA